jgi:D-sedoheptulose 7-phosphate isomerase
LKDRANFDRAGYITDYVEDLRRILTEMEHELAPALSDAADLLDDARLAGRHIYVMGNGGSGSAASHFATDLNKYTVTPGERRFKCVALTDSIPLILALGNDLGYEEVFVEQLRNLAEPGDVLIGISGSGNSMNCVKAMEFARAQGVATISWTGFGGGRMAELADCKLVIPSDSMVRCEDTHVIVHHCLVSMLKAELDSRSGAVATGRA